MLFNECSYLVFRAIHNAKTKFGEPTVPQIEANKPPSAYLLDFKELSDEELDY